MLLVFSESLLAPNEGCSPRVKPLVPSKQESYPFSNEAYRERRSTIKGIYNFTHIVTPPLPPPPLPETEGC
jgi:hypothetical protein